MTNPRASLAVLLFRVLPVALLVAFLSSPLNDYDTWFYLDMGRWMLENGAYLDREIRTFTSAQAHMLNVSWLFQIVLAAVYRLAGLYGLMALQAGLLFLELWLLALAAVRKPRDGIPFVVALVVLAPQFGFHYTLRPHLVEHVCLAGLILLFRTPTQTRKLLALAMLILIWANSHGSSLVGAGVVALHLALDREPRAALPRHGRRIALAACYLLLPFMTPMGMGLWKLLTLTREDVAYLAISEWVAPEFFPPFLFLLTMGYLAALLARSYPVLVGELILIVFYFCQTVMHTRFVHELAILLLLPAAHFISLLHQRLEPVWLRLTPVLLTAMAAVLFLLYHPPLSRWKEFPEGYPLDIQALPQGSAALVNVLSSEAGRPLRLLNPYEWGGYLGFALEERAAIFVDGRASMVFDRELVRENFHAYVKNSSLLRHLADRWEVDLIITHLPVQKDELEIPWDDPQWRLIGFDKTSLLYARRAPGGSGLAASWPEIPYLPGRLAVDMPAKTLMSAAEATRSMVLRYPENPWAWAQLGILETALVELGRSDGPGLAVEAWRKAWESLRGPEARIHYARALHMANRPEAEIDALLQGLPAQLPESSAPYLENFAAQLMLELSRPQDALRMLKPKNKYRLHQLDSEPLTWYFRGQAMSAMSDIASAEAFWVKGKTLSSQGKWPPSMRGEQ